MSSAMSLEFINCKYCGTLVEDINAEGLVCIICQNKVHIKCLRSGCAPVELAGDIFFSFTCAECSDTKSEVYVRDKITWLQAIAISLYHLQNKSPGLARKGYFHWKIHIVAFIDKYWNVLFRKDFRRKKQWMGAISGSLSNYSPHFFRSGTLLFGEQGWWTLSFPKLTPNAIFQINARILYDKQKCREEHKPVKSDLEKLSEICLEKNYLTQEELTAMTNVNVRQTKDSNVDTKLPVYKSTMAERKPLTKASLLPTFENYYEVPKKLMKLPESPKISSFTESHSSSSRDSENNVNDMEKIKQQKKPIKLMDPLCHYNTSLKNFSLLKGETLKTKLLGGTREEHILSPYTGIYLKPYIRRDNTSQPGWLSLLAEIQLTVNSKKADYVLPPRGPIDFVYVQPEHISAINSLCNQFFWPGIDLTECLQYPDYSCVVLYRKLIVAFAFLVPDVKVSENYMSFIFTRPGWRNCGIGRFMLYHLTQVSIGKDITLHVSINNPALFLYQKFGFKVEHVALDFYDKYIRSDAKESKHAFFCRLER